MFKDTKFAKKLRHRLCYKNDLRLVPYKLRTRMLYKLAIYKLGTKNPESIKQWLQNTFEATESWEMERPKRCYEMYPVHTFKDENHYKRSKKPRKKRRRASYKKFIRRFSHIRIV